MTSNLLLDQDVDDLATVSFIDEKLLVEILRCRYRKKKIFTSIGEILISVNPFEPVTVCRGYLDPQIPGNISVPDVRNTASLMFRSLLEKKRSQCCIFSGESGSGKTEASKNFLCGLMELCQGDADLEKRIIVVNPVLEAFGNATTSLNNNSSRFGKFIQIYFDDCGRALGAKISEYLLEKSRVTHRNPGDSNFHIFRIVMQELPREQFRKLKLDADVYYGYLQEPDTLHHKQKSAADLQKLQSFDSLTSALSVVGFARSEQDSIFTILAAILALGNIRFTEEPGSSRPFIDDSEKYMKNAANLLKIDKHNLKNQLQNLEIYSRGEIISRPYTRAEAEDCRDSIARVLYNRLFGWIIYRINQVLKPSIHFQGDVNIGVLDIFGFENLQRNSFEQLCINLANEQLQQFFYVKIFKQEQNEYRSEGLGMDIIEYADNLDLLNLLLDRPIGLFSLLDEESHFPQGSDSSFVAKCITHFGSNHKYFRSSFRSHSSQESLEPKFTITHYAGNVVYNATGFLEKNRDSLPERISTLLQSSSHAVVSELFRATVTRTGSLRFDNAMTPDGKIQTAQKDTVLFARSTRKRLTLGYQFKASLSVLLEKLSLSDTFFVRCIKPNNEQVPGKFDSSSVMLQLRHTGVLETVKIRRQGFSYRPTCDEMLLRFRGLFNSSFDGQQLIEKVLEPYGCQSWHLGKTKVFIKYNVADDLDSRLHLRETAARKIQRYYRKHLWEQRRSALKTALELNIPPTSSDQANEDNATGSNGGYIIGLSTSDNYSLADSNQVRQWFRDCVYDQIAPKEVRREKVTGIDWCHRDLTRIEAEALLKHEPDGTYLIRSNRKSPSVLVLSFRAPDPKAFRHYLIDQTPAGQFIIRGEQELHNSIPELLAYHQHQHLSNYHGCLTNPCGHQPLADRDDFQPTQYDQLLPKLKNSGRRTLRYKVSQSVPSIKL